jgi:hypothetical protein
VVYAMFFTMFLLKAFETISAMHNTELCIANYNSNIFEIHQSLYEWENTSTKTVPKIQKPYEFHYISGMIYYKFIANYHSQEMFCCI